MGFNDERHVNLLLLEETAELYYCALGLASVPIDQITKASVECEIFRNSQVGLLKIPFKTELSFTARRSNPQFRLSAADSDLPSLLPANLRLVFEAANPVWTKSTLRAFPSKWLLPPSRCTRVCHVGSFWKCLDGFRTLSYSTSISRSFTSTSSAT